MSYGPYHVERSIYSETIGIFDLNYVLLLLAFMKALTVFFGGGVNILYREL